jgi:hypothetical protein
VYQPVCAGELLDLIAGEVLQRILALTSRSGTTITPASRIRSLVASDH